MGIQHVMMIAMALVACMQLAAALTANDINIPGKCANQLVDGSSPIPASYITASSTYGICSIASSRFNYAGSGNIGWCAATNAGLQWIQYRFPTVKQVTGIAITGRADDAHSRQFVRTFQVQYGTSAANTYYREAGTIKTFQGVVNRHHMRVVTFNNPIFAKYIRIIPLKYNVHKSLRADILGC